MSASPTPSDLELSVVIPCLDESGTIAICVKKAVDAMRAANIRGEVVVSDNGSKDDSIAVATAAGARVVNCPVRGYGAALQYGFEAARGKYLLMGDADDSYDFGLLPRFVEQLRAGHPYVIGSRLRGKIEPGAMPTLNRHLGTPVLTFILNRLFGTHISDCNCGMRGFRRETFFQIGAVSPGMEFASEMIVKAAIRGVPIEEVPIDFHKDKRGRAPHLRPWRDGWRHLRLLLWHAPERVMTLPGLLLTLCGTALVLWQLGGPYEWGGARLGLPLMLLGLLAALIGLPAAAIGLGLQASSAPGRLRGLAPLGAVSSWLTFDRAMIAAGLLLLSALLCLGGAGMHAELSGLAEPSAFDVRLFLVGILLLAGAIHAALLAHLVGSGRSVLAPEVPPFPKGGSVGANR